MVLTLKFGFNLNCKLYLRVLQPKTLRVVLITVFIATENGQSRYFIAYLFSFSFDFFRGNYCLSSTNVE
jgi:hypothetical protein